MANEDEEVKDAQPAPERRSYRGATIANVAPGIDPAVHLQHADWMSGNVDTSDTADLIQNQVAAVSPAFAIHQRNAAVQAARALDPNDPGVSRRSVVLPQDHRAAQEAQRAIIEGANYAVDHPLVLGGSTNQPYYPGSGVVANEDDEEKAEIEAGPAEKTEAEWPQG